MGLDETHDEVDDVVAAWQTQRPDIDGTPMQVFSRITRMARRLDKVRKRAFAAHQLETWEFDVLAALRRSGDPFALSPGQLVTATMVTSGTMTNRVDRLVERAFVTRERSTDDRRGVSVRLTPAGRERVDAALDALLEAEAAMLAGLSATEKEHLAAALRHLSHATSR